MKRYVLIIFSLFLVSCSSVVSRSKMSGEARYNDDLIYYTGTKVNYEVLSNPSKKQLFLRYVLGIPDMPLSMIMDTAFLPIDFMVYRHEQSKLEKTESLISSIYSNAEQMLSLIKLNDFGRFERDFVDEMEAQTSLFNVGLRNLDEESAKPVKDVLQKFLLSEFKEASYERGGRLYFKVDEYLLSFRKGRDCWLISTLTQNLDLK